ncbi:MAG: hypothetical protein K2X27_26375 [Candidatus Obscuribacterales bacterium]|nr:hypothetical protein [Candidatus Obscuribacterales bacterium]
MKIIVSSIFILLALSSVFVAVFGKTLRQKAASVATSTVAISFLGSLCVFFYTLSGSPFQVELTLTPDSPNWLHLSAYIDRLSAIMMVLVTGVSTVVHAYAVKYLFGDSGYNRFFVLLGLLTQAVLAMVSSGNLLLLLVWWQLVSLLLYFLLSYNYTNRSAVKTAFASLLTLRIGDIAFLIAVFLAYKLFGTLEFSELFQRAQSSHLVYHLWSGGPTIDAVSIITLLILLAAMTKSAQFPFHSWLPNTMDAPTPVSAFMHAGIVNAGGFLINRLAPLYGSSPLTLHVAFVLGLLTAIIGTAIMLTRTDLKTKLGFSTVGQMGFMIMECGLGAFALAIFHLIAHGIFKATLFLHAGNVVHEIRKEANLPEHYEEHSEKSLQLPWATGVLITLVVPLLILIGAHALLGSQMNQGTIIFLFFAWVTSSEAIMSLYSLKMYGSWKAVVPMLLAVGLVIVTYLWAAESFTEFLYPVPGSAHSYFQSASFPLWIFDLFIGMIVLLFLCAWEALRPGGGKIAKPFQKQTRGALVFLYVVLWDGLRIGSIGSNVARFCLRLARRCDFVLPEWIP